MPGLETAASAFAVVGAADVAVRVGRKVYAFLRDVVDAPESIKRLCEEVHEITVLAAACEKAKNSLNQSPQPSGPNSNQTSFDSGLKAVDRALRTLQIITARCGGKTTTWTKLKFVMDEKKIRQSLKSLERAKALLTNALVLTYGELSSKNTQDLERLIRHHSEQLRLELDALSTNVQSSLGMIRQDIDANNKMFKKQLNSSIAYQKNTLTLTKRTSRTTKEMSGILANTQHAISRNHVQARDMMSGLSDQIAKLHVAVSQGSVGKTPRGRQVRFLGDRRDLIVFALSSLRKHLTEIEGNMPASQDGTFSYRQFYWLDSQLESILGSAAQEEAARYAGSSARPFDEWSYSHELHTISEDSSMQKTESRELSNSLSSTNLHQKPTGRKRRLKYHVNSESRFGRLQICLPQFNTGIQGQDPTDEIKLSFRGQSNHQKFTMEVFLANCNIYSAYSSISAQLNIGILAESNKRILIEELIYTSSVEEFDLAIRQGMISPYCVDMQGMNCCIFDVIKFRRTDLLDYMDRQGIGITALRDNLAVALGFIASFFGKHSMAIPDSSVYLYRQIHDALGEGIREGSDGYIWILFYLLFKPKLEASDVYYCKSIWEDVLNEQTITSELYWKQSPLAVYIDTLPDLVTLKPEPLERAWNWILSIESMATEKFGVTCIEKSIVNILIMFLDMIHVLKLQMKISGLAWAGTYILNWLPRKTGNFLDFFNTKETGWLLGKIRETISYGESLSESAKMSQLDTTQDT